MVKLMIYAGSAAPDTTGTRMGGIPLAPAGFEWPRCRRCSGAMQFLAQVDLADADPQGAGLLSIFMCQNDPGLCSEWEPLAGGNHVFIFDAGAVQAATVPPDGATSLEETCAVRLDEVVADDYLDAQQRWQQHTGGDELDVIGQIGGRPLWAQGDETPTCRDCAQPMALVVQLQEGHGEQNLANFGGGGCGYAFRCGPCGTAAFLWQ